MSIEWFEIMSCGRTLNENIANATAGFNSGAHNYACTSWVVAWYYEYTSGVRSDS